MNIQYEKPSFKSFWLLLPNVESCKLHDLSYLSLWKSLIESQVVRLFEICSQNAPNADLRLYCFQINFHTQMNYELSIILNFAFSHRQQSEKRWGLFGMKGRRKDSVQDLSPSIVPLSRAKDVFYWRTMERDRKRQAEKFPFTSGQSRKLFKGSLFWRNDGNW